MSLSPLWVPGNISIFSDVFNVPVGQVCVLHAVNFALKRVRISAEEVDGPQAVCIRRLLHELKMTGQEKATCGFTFNIDNVRAATIVDALVQTCGLPWQLTACKNIGIIGVPGSYRLELNDATAIGVAQVYAELYNASSIPSQVQNLFF